MKLTVTVESLAAFMALQQLPGVTITDAPTAEVQPMQATPRPRRAMPTTTPLAVNMPALATPQAAIAAVAPTAAPTAPRANAVVYRLAVPLANVKIGGNNRITAEHIATHPNITSRELKAVLGLKPKAVESALHSLRTAGIIVSIPVD